MTVQYNIDSLAITDGSWRIWGWAFSQSAAVADITLRLTFGSQTISRNLMVRGHRPDVGAAFSAIPSASYSGFVGFGEAPRDQLSRAEMEVLFSNGHAERIDLARFVQTKVSRAAWFWAKAKIAGRLLKAGQYKTLAHKVLGVARTATFRRPGMVLDRMPASLYDEPAALIVDHAMGGGTNTFSAQLRERLTTARTPFVVVRYLISEMAYLVEVHEAGERHGLMHNAHTVDDVVALLSSINFGHIHVNSTVSFPSNDAILSLIASVTRATSQVVFYVHDYYSICPSFNLLNHDGSYCDIPTTSYCNNVCLPKNRDLFLLSQSPTSIEEWRAKWLSLIERSNQIRFFSEASKALFCRAFPDASTSRMITEPHVVSGRSALETFTVHPAPGLRVAVVGTVNHAKGSDVVVDLCRYVAATGVDLTLVVFGTIDRGLDFPFVTITGPYERDSLPRLFQRHNINVALFPSIWPETFSFVVSELSAMNVPIVAFDVGAPGERLRQQANAKLLPLSATPSQVVDAMTKVSSGELPSTAATVRTANRTCAFTSAATNYLPKAMLLASSLKKYHPEMDVFYGLSDEVDSSTDYRRGVFDGVIAASELPIRSFASWSFRHEIVELSTAIKPFLVQELFRRGYETVYYFDPDIVLFSRLDDLLAQTEAHSISLTPHQTTREFDFQAVVDNEISSLKHGVYNLGYLGVRNTEIGREFADWWADRLYRWCRDDIPNGLFTDQRWIDLAPALFPDVTILRDSRFNVSTWNLTRRHFSGTERDGYLVDGRPLGFYHFTGFDKGAHRVMAEKNSKSNPSVMSLVDWYQRAIQFAPDDSASKVKWAYGQYSDGAKIPVAHRRVYRDREDLHAAFPDPFKSVPNGGFREWVRTQGRLEYPLLEL